MSNRNNKKQHKTDAMKAESSVDTTTFGFEEMLSELEAIVAQAQDRQAEEAETA